MNYLKGIVLALLICSTAVSYAQRLQAIHNSADPALDTMDVYISLFGSVLQKVEDVPFRAGTPFIDAPLPGFTLDVGIAPGNSTSVSDTVKNFEITLVSGITYVGLISGVLDPNQFVPNPDGLSISIDGAINSNGREISNTPGEVDFFFSHGVTDAPTLDISIQNGATLVDDVSYGEFTGYVSLNPTSYQINITDASGITVFHSLLFDLSEFADSAITVFASGFEDPSSNQNGAPFGLFAATPSGNVVEFSTLTDFTEPSADIADQYQLHQNFPNPFNPSTTIRYQLPANGDVQLTIFNALGQEVKELVNQNQAAGAHEIQWNGRDKSGQEVASGVYIYKISSGEFVQSRKMLLMK